jgi:DNA-binding GntR family transcriptional regulator
VSTTPATPPRLSCWSRASASASSSRSSRRTSARSRPDLTGNLAADRDFHLSLLAAGGNRRLVASVARLRDQTRLHNLRAINADGRLVASADEHRPLLTAITRHDERTAERLMRQHLEHIRQDWSRPVE